MRDRDERNIIDGSSSAGRASKENVAELVAFEWIGTGDANGQEANLSTIIKASTTSFLDPQWIAVAVELGHEDIEGTQVGVEQTS